MGNPDSGLSSCSSAGLGCPWPPYLRPLVLAVRDMWIDRKTYAVPSSGSALFPKPSPGTSSIRLA